jgi:predicted glycoside hydrolase/deacetylase ChbG (UPF0249 family)
MVFMEDSQRAAEVAKGVGIEVGLHLNYSQSFTGLCQSKLLQDYHRQILRFINSGKYAFLIYNPALRRQFRYVYEAQVDEFMRLYGKAPSHIDGHHHKHLCNNVVFDSVIADGTKVRRNFSFSSREKSLLNRAYRRFVDEKLARRYRITDHFFSLHDCLVKQNLRQVVQLSHSATVEIMTHPHNVREYSYLMSDDFLADLCNIEKGTYGALSVVQTTNRRRKCTVRRRSTIA